MSTYTPPITVTIEDARIIFKNFAGKEQQFNAAGDRNFCLVLEPELSEQMIADGWNVKYLNPREDGDDPIAYLQVKVAYKHKPPRIMVLTSSGATPYNQDMVETLDYLEVSKWDIIIQSSRWEVNGKTGISAYLKTMYVTAIEDDLDKKYAAILHGNVGVPEDE